MSGKREIRKQFDKKVTRIGIIVLAVFILVTIAVAAWWHFWGRGWKGERTYEGIRKAAVKEEEEPYQSEIDFEELWKQNPDAYAWIKVPGTKVDYPVLQKEGGNTYYLEHSIDGSEGLPGSIYTETPNSKTFDDNNIVIYGHNMLNDTMFSELYKYSDKSFMEQYPYVYIYLPDRTLKYQVFASVVYSNEYLPAKYDFVQRDSYQKFLEEIDGISGEGCYVDPNVQVTPDDRMITMSTCVKDQPENRRLTLAVRVVEE